MLEGKELAGKALQSPQQRKATSLKTFWDHLLADSASGRCVAGRQHTRLLRPRNADPVKSRRYILYH